MKRAVLVALVGASFLVSCSTDQPRHRPGGMQRREAFHPPGESMLHFDANHDGSVTTAELNAGLHADFTAADTNHDGVLEEDEIRAVNAARWASEASASTPLIDWNNDGHVDFHEFAAGPRALFEQIDRNNDGVLDNDELHPHHYEGKVPQHTRPPGPGE